MTESAALGASIRRYGPAGRPSAAVGVVLSASANVPVTSTLGTLSVTLTATEPTMPALESRKVAGRGQLRQQQRPAQAQAQLRRLDGDDAGGAGDGEVALERLAGDGQRDVGARDAHERADRQLQRDRGAVELERLVDLRRRRVDLDAQGAGQRDVRDVERDRGREVAGEAAAAGDQAAGAAADGDQAAAERQAQVGDRDAQDGGVGRGAGAAGRAVGAERLGRLEREVAAQGLAGERELDAGAGDPQVRAGDQLQRDVRAADGQRRVDGGVGRVDGEGERAGEARVARQRDAESCPRSSPARPAAVARKAPWPVVSVAPALALPML